MSPINRVHSVILKTSSLIVLLAIMCAVLLSFPSIRTALTMCCVSNGTSLSRHYVLMLPMTFMSLSPRSMMTSGVIHPCRFLQDTVVRIESQQRQIRRSLIFSRMVRLLKKKGSVVILG
ncbi:hypothetical protein HD806DRAFT_516713 [Xylariaceae sp. AK1471]|nr:hypothetical protein HD806DRAFT_516713 [Xylariaceae sp. AK1471]